MVPDQQANSVKRYLPHVVICTAAVTLVPIALVTFLEASGLIRSVVLSSLIAASVSVTIATTGLWIQMSRMWAYRPVSE
jgi:spore maturation protein SpmA